MIKLEEYRIKSWNQQKVELADLDNNQIILYNFWMVINAFDINKIELNQKFNCYIFDREEFEEDKVIEEFGGPITNVFNNIEVTKCSLDGQSIEDDYLSQHFKVNSNYKETAIKIKLTRNQELFNKITETANKDIVRECYFYFEKAK